MFANSASVMGYSWSKNICVSRDIFKNFSRDFMLPDENNYYANIIILSLVNTQFVNGNPAQIAS